MLARTLARPRVAVALKSSLSSIKCKNNPEYAWMLKLNLCFVSFFLPPLSNHVGERQPIKAAAPTSFLFTSSKQTFACANVALETSLRIQRAGEAAGGGGGSAGGV